jgi:hypothetical protein
MPQGASQLEEVSTKVWANEVQQVIDGTPGQIIGQKRRTAMQEGCPDCHLGLRLVIPAYRAPNAGSCSEQTVQGNKWPISFQSHRF